jgi:hypothetical protein
MLLKDWSEYDCKIDSDEEFTAGAGGYPTDLARAVILLWPQRDYATLYKFIEDIWWCPEWGWREPEAQTEASRELADSPAAHGMRYRISTGGWSGNEDLLRTMQDNYGFWVRHYYSHRRGGHYEFLPAQV